jgi:hypothetical protein
MTTPRPRRGAALNPKLLQLATRRRLPIAPGVLRTPIDAAVHVVVTEAQVPPSNTPTTAPAHRLTLARPEAPATGRPAPAASPPQTRPASSRSSGSDLAGACRSPSRTRRTRSAIDDSRTRSEEATSRFGESPAVELVDTHSCSQMLSGGHARCIGTTHAPTSCDRPISRTRLRSCWGCPPRGDQLHRRGGVAPPGRGAGADGGPSLCP